MDNGYAKLIGVPALLASMVLAACSGGGGGGGGASTTAITGTAATGVPIAGKVVAVDKNGVVFSGTSSATGAYTINVAGGSAPFMLTITGMAGGKMATLNSVATAANQTVNITPLTDLIVSAAAGQPGGAALNSLCVPDAAGAVSAACTTALTNATTGTRLADAVTTVKNMVAPLNTGNVDPLNGAFTANGTGMDAVLDQIVMTPASAQGGQATVTLIAVPAASLGSVTLPASAGGTVTTAAGTATATDITTSTTAQTALDEIRVCMASFSALYPGNMTAAPTSSQVAAFVDPGFLLNKTINATTFASYLSTLPTAAAGTNAGMAVAGMKFEVAGYSRFDFSSETGNGSVYPKATAAYDSVAGTAWVQINGSGSSNMGFFNWKLVKGAAYSGCAGGWKLAGNDHFEMHMTARISKENNGSTTVYKRYLPMHVPSAYPSPYAQIIVRNQALSLYSGNPASPIGTANAPVTLLPPTALEPTMHVQDASGYYGRTEAIQSCQDLAAASVTTAGVPCYDESVLAPGKIFKYQVYLTANTTIGTTNVADYSFPFQINAVPLSQSFVQANQADLFAQNLSATPAGVTAMNTAVSGLATGASLDGIITYAYTNTAVYGTQTNHCGIALFDASNAMLLNAEQNADGLATQQTGCTFNTAGLNSGQSTFVKPAVAFGGTSNRMWVGNMVLGNQAVTSMPY